MAGSLAGPSPDPRYGDVALPYAPRCQEGNHVDEYMDTHSRSVGTLRANAENESLGLWAPEDAELGQGRYRYIPGRDSCSDEHIDELLGEDAQGLGPNGLPPVRWKHVDLWESRRGNEFLPKCYMCPPSRPADPLEEVAWERVAA